MPNGKRRDEWLAGYACALADLHRLYKFSSVVKGTMVGGNITLRQLEQANVEPYDLVELRRAWPEPVV